MQGQRQRDVSEIRALHEWQRQEENAGISLPSPLWQLGFSRGGQTIAFPFVRGETQRYLNSVCFEQPERCPA